MRKLDKRDIEDILSLAPMQEGILFHYLQAPGSEVYFEQLSLEISGKIDLKLFEVALDFVIENNEMLRTMFRWERLETPLQIILKKYNLQLRYYDFTKTDPGEVKKRLQQLKNNDRKSKFHLTEVPFRVILCKVKEYKYVMIVSNHHILYDGWSTGIILNEFFTAYHDLSNGKKLVKPIKTKFRMFIQWLQDQDFVKQEKFWRNYLKNFDTQTGLSVKSRGKEKEITVTDTKNCQARFEKDIKDKLEGFVKKHRITLAALLYSAWGILLQKYNNIDDVVFGTTVSGRAAKIPGIEDMVGLFINTIPLRVQTLPHEKTEDLLYRIDKALQMREKYETTSLVKIREYSDFAYNEELFDSIVVIENYPLEIKSMQGNSKLFIESHSMVEWTHYDLTISITIEDDIEVIFSYNNKLFDQWIIERLSDHFVCVVQSMTEKPGEEVSEIELIGEEEKRQILIHFNKTGLDYPGDKPINELFAGQVSKIPDYMALVGMTGIVGTHHANTNAGPLKNEVSVTYRELNERANQLAFALREKGAAPGTIVGIMLERSIEMIVGILAVLKAGGAYLPIDPDYPADRIAYMLSDSVAKVLVTTGILAEGKRKIGRWEDRKNLEILFLNSSYLTDFPASPPPRFLVSHLLNLAYVIYTSGSTGKPKGVMVEHRNVNYLVYGLRERIYKNYGENLKVCLVSPFVFDASVKQIFGALLLGYCLSIVPEEARINGEALFEFYKKHRVDISDGTPVHLQLLMENQGRNCPGVRNYLIGGEPLSRKTADGFLNRFVEDDPGIINVYGPTECTVDAASYHVNRENIGRLHTIPIGNPLPNCRIYVLARRNNLQPIGIPGELCIMGKGVSRGYLNLPELTAEKFIEQVTGASDGWETPSNKKFLRESVAAGGQFLQKEPPGRQRQKIYRTGDLARWLPKGNIEFLGRLDQQVKIRGYRIELGEIENQLLTHKETKDAVVIAREGLKGEKSLCAYIVAGTVGFNVSAPALREYLSGKLPGYMIPAYFAFMEKLPLTATGKVDRRALPAPKISSNVPYVVPRDKVEKKLVEIWSSLLEVAKERIGIDDNFFLLGGHSLKVTTLTARIHKEFNVKVGVRDIFRTPILKDIADYIRGLEKEAYSTIEPMEEKEYYPASSAQQRLYFLQQLVPDSLVYNMSTFLELEGELCKDKLEFVLRQLVERHESFRTSFHQEADLLLPFPQGITVQVIHRDGDIRFSMEYYDGELGGQSALQAFIRPFDLSQVPLLRAALVNMSPARHILMLDMHHIISDGISTDILAREFIALYSGEELLALNVRYHDFSCWQKRYFTSPDFLRQEVFWLEQFRGDVPVLELPLDFPRPSLQVFEGAAAVFEVESAEIGALKEVASRNGATLFMLWTAIYTIFLSKLTGSEDIVVGTPAAGRSHADLEGIIGFFVNSLALRNYPIGEKTFTAFLQEVKQRALRAFENQDYPFEKLVEKVAVNRDIGRNPLFDTMLSMQNTVIPGMRIPGLTLKLHDVDTAISKFDLSLIGEEVGDRIIFRFNYYTKLFKNETAGRFIKYFKRLVSSVVGNCHGRIAGLEILSPEEKKTLLEDFNNTAAVYPKDKTLHQLFERQVEKSPYTIAAAGKCLVSGYESLSITYHELSEKSTQLAHRLMEMDVQSDTIVGIMVERSIDMIIGILGILKAGGAYLPIDPDCPEERKQYMLADSGVKVLLIGNISCSSIFSSMPGTLLNLTEGLHFEFSSTSLPPFYPSQCSSLAYVIYTSGTTGRPRGVMAVHENVVNVVTWFAREYDVKMRSNVLQMSNYTFDASVNQIFATLLHGGRLHMVNNALLQDMGALRRHIEKNLIHILNFVPLFLNELLGHQDRLQSVQIVISGGEALTDSIKKRITEKGYQLYNHYGPTETTIDTLSLRCEPSCGVTLGKPIANTRCAVLDRWERLVPVGIPGELAVTGTGVARGYLNQPGLTAEKFINPHFNTDLYKFIRPTQLPCLSVYKTGDLVRWLPDGNIEFLGRIDHQVKIRGFRIELGEIENRLLSHAYIRDVVVLCREDRINDKYLCAYIVPHPTGAFNKTASAFPELREYLSLSLPEYMLPRYFMELEKIPLTPNGKIDRKALLEFKVSYPGISNEHEAPSNEIEEKLTDIWSEVLSMDKDKISIHANFFQLGGHSLKATILATKIHKAFDVKLQLAQIFKTPTIRELSGYIRVKPVENKFASIEPGEKKELYILSSAQKRLYILHQLEMESSVYNIPGVMTLKGALFKGKFEKIFRKIIERHESLRTSFGMIDKEPVQRVHDEVEFEIEYYDLIEENLETHKTHLDPAAAFSSNSQLTARTIKNFIRPFDLSHAPLLRVGLIELEEKMHLLMVDMHHIISDGTSMGVFVKEFMAFYEGKELPASRLQYKDFSEWRNRSQQVALIKQQEMFWLNEFAGEIPVLELPADYTRPSVQSFEGSSKNFEITPEVTDALKALAIETGTTMYMVLLAIYCVFLARISSQEDIVIGTPLAGRRHTDLEKIIGMFVNTLALRNYPSGEKSFRALLLEIKEKTLKAFESQEYQYEDLVEQVTVSRDISRNPLFDTMFVLQNDGIHAIDIPGLRVVPYEYENNTSKFDLTLTGVESDRKLLFTFRYSIKLFEPETIERFVTYFMNTVRCVVENKHREISRIEIITGEEKKRILHQFNAAQVEFPGDKTIHQLFEEQVEKTPHHIAVVGPSVSVETIHELPLQVTYNEMNEKSSRLAHLLREKGVQPDTIAGLMVEPLLEMIIGIFAIMKAGGAYLPLEPDQPAKRRSYMLKDSCSTLLLTTRRSTAEEVFSGLIVTFDDAAVYREESTGIKGISSPGNIFYSIYTSGTTGKSKGVLIENKNVVNYLNWFMRKTSLTTDDRALLTSSFGFDLGYTTLYPSILNGGQLHIIPRGIYLSPENLIQYIVCHCITYLKMTPSLFSTIVESSEFTKENCGELRLVLLGGEEIKIKDVEKAHAIGPHIEIMNHYGPTEATIGCVAQEIDLDVFEQYKKRPVIGRPIDNMKVSILDKVLTLVPVGLSGELCVCGKGVGRGYLNRPELTGEKFIFHPYLNDEKLYRTGDMARWTGVGLIEFLGRIDNQIKIRGYRVEIGEIENNLVKHEAIKEAAVIHRKYLSGDGYLCAHIVWKQDKIVDKAAKLLELKEFLSGKLPDYMIPQYFVQVEKIPITPNGKIDRKMLPAPEIKAGKGYVPPRNQLEKKLIEIWAELLTLDKEQIGIDDNFFQLGGHSLKATILISKMHKELNVKVALSEIFKNPSVRKLSGIIKISVRNEYISILKTEEKNYYEVSSAQKRLYILDEIQDLNTTYNLPAAFVITGKIDISLFKEVFQELVQRHESLRTSFQMQAGVLVQVIHRQVSSPIHYRELNMDSVENEIQLKKIVNEYIKPFDLSKAPLIRANLLKLTEDEHLFILDMHHIISDGVSMNILAHDFVRLYGGEQLPPVKLKYRDFAVWQKKWFESEEFKNQEKFWLNRINGKVPSLNIITDYPRPSVQSFEGDYLEVVLDKKLSEYLTCLSGETTATLYMILLAIFNILLSKYAGQQDILVGSPIAGRNHADLENIVGFFVNTLVMRNIIKKDQSFRDSLEDVKINTFEAFKNQDYPFEELVNKLNIKKHLSNSPIFDVFFVSENMELPELKMNDLEFIPYPFENKISHFDLVFYVLEVADEIGLKLEYSTSLFKPSTAKQMLNHYIEILKQVVENPEIQLKEIKISHDLLAPKVKIQEMEFGF